MAQLPRKLTPHHDARAFFGAELRHWREARKLSQDRLGAAVHVSGDEIAKVEKAVRWPPPGLAERCDEHLQTGGVLARLWPLVDRQRTQARSASAKRRITAGALDPSAIAESKAGMGAGTDLAQGGDTPPDRLPAVFTVDEEGQVWASVGRRRFLLGTAATTASTAIAGSAHLNGGTSLGAVPPGVIAKAAAASLPADAAGFAAVVRASWPGTRLERLTTAADGAPDSSTDIDWSLVLPPGRTLAGGSAGTQLHAAEPTDDGVRLTPGTRLERFAGASNRGLVIGAVTEPDSVSFFGLDSREARRRLAAADDRHAPSGSLTIPAAYELDDLVYGALWALTGLDDALQADDQALELASRQVDRLASLPRSEVSREEMPELSPVAQMWLGSDFCARHILRHLDGLGEVPVFWTREQRGEEAATWLLFSHKLEYLRQVNRRFGNGSRPISRAFCLPEKAVAGSTRSERMLLLLCAALMEAHGIRIQVSTDPAHEEVPGFVMAHDANGPAVIATWMRSERLWHVDRTGSRAQLRDFADAVASAANDRAVTGQAPHERLRRLAEYLGLDWRWLRQRAGRFAEHSWSGITRPRSRLLTVSGLDTACRYLGVLPA